MLSDYDHEGANMYTRKISKLLRAAVTVAILCGAASIASAAPPNKVGINGDVIGEFVGDCDTFTLLSDYVFDGFLIEHFDKEGNITQVNQHVEFGQSIYYRSDDPTIFLVGGPGELSNGLDFTDDLILTFSGIRFKVIVPGHGVIFHFAGHIIFDLITGDVVFQSGPSDFSRGDVAALCAALSL